MMKKYFLVFCCLMLNAGIVKAVGTTALVVSSTTEQPYIFFLSEKPEIFFGNRGLEIYYQGSATSILISDIQDFHFEKREYSSSIEELVEPPGQTLSILWLDKETVRISGLFPNDTVQIYSHTGQMVYSQSYTDGDDFTTISLANLTPGIYIISISNKKSFKIIKK